MLKITPSSLFLPVPGNLYTFCPSEFANYRYLTKLFLPLSQIVRQENKEFVRFCLFVFGWVAKLVKS